MTKIAKYLGTGLVTALSILLLSTVCIKFTYCATVDDLRELIGMTIENNEIAGKKEYPVIVEKSGNSNENNGTSGGASNGEQYNSNLVRLESRLKQDIEENAPAFRIVSDIDSIIDIKDKIDESNRKSAYDTLASSGSSGATGSVGGYEDTNTLNSLDLSSEAIKKKDYTIGGIGTDCISITGDFKSLVTPWGFIVHEDGTYTDKLLGVDFRVNLDTPIKSQWNGIVVGVDADSLIGSKITIYHSNGLYTSYSHIKAAEDVHINMEVQQGQIIGYAMETSKYENNKKDHVFYQIMIDGDYINPLLVYGNSGKTIYEKWYRSTAEVNLVEENEEYFIEEDISKVIDYDGYVRDNTKEVLYPEFNREIYNEEEYIEE